MSESALQGSGILSSAAAAALDYWVARCLEGEESAYEVVYNQYSGAIYRLCYSLLRHREDAEEVLQDTFEYAFRRLEKFDVDKASFKTWLYQIAVSRCRNKRRRKWLLTLPLSHVLGGKLADHSVASPDQSISFSEQQQIVWRALGKLSTKLRETTILRYYEGMTYGQIGEILSIPPKTAESRMRLAHNALRHLLADELGNSEEERKND